MTERLRPRDLALLATESPSTPMHNATVEIFEPGDSGFDYARLVELISDRIAFVPRYRQRLQAVPGRLANPVWVDDPDFEIGYHVRRSALPRPGDHHQLRELVARIASRPLDRSRPLWEIYFVEGLEGGRVAVLTKSHQILVDGRETVDIGQVLLDTTPEAPDLGHDEWQPRGRPTALGLALGRGHRHPRAARHRRSTRCGPTPSRPRAPSARPPTRSAASPARWPAGAPSTAARSTGRSRSSAGSSPSAPSSTSTSASAASTAAPSTTSSWPPSPVPCAAG